MNRTLTIILAGGKGQRLYPISKERAKPSLPFGGKYLIIDFVLSNFINSGFFKIKILTQFRSESLSRHITHAYNISPILDHQIETVPPQMKTGKSLYKGSADAVFQNIDLINERCFDNVCVFCADQIFRMDIRQLHAYHEAKKADATIIVAPVSIKHANRFTVVEVDDDWKIIGYRDRPQDPKPIPGYPDYALISMGNNIFNTGVLLESVKKDSLRDDSGHDFSKDVIPGMIRDCNVYAYNFMDNDVPGAPEQECGYWRTIENVDSYWWSNMDIVSVERHFNLYNQSWPVRTYCYPLPPARISFANHDGAICRGEIANSIISEGCEINGGFVNQCILSPLVKIGEIARVSESILMKGANIGRNAMVKRAIIDEFVRIPPGMKIGYNLKEDKKNFYVSPAGVVVVDRNSDFDTQNKEYCLLDKRFMLKKDTKDSDNQKKTKKASFNSKITANTRHALSHV